MLSARVSVFQIEELSIVASNSVDKNSQLFLSDIIPSQSGTNITPEAYKCREVAQVYILLIAHKICQLQFYWCCNCSSSSHKCTLHESPDPFTAIAPPN